MKQKFGKLSFVKVCDDMPECMRHFESGFDAIVCGTYSQIYGGTDIKSYSLYMIRDGIIVNRTSWYREPQLTLLENQDKDKAEQMIEDYNFREEL
jgi:hypothetical protein